MPPKIFESEQRFCRILWAHEPINSTALVMLCKEQLGWSKATTYTVIRRLSERGVVKNEHAVVRSLVSRDEVRTAQADELMARSFDGSLPAFLAAFLGGKTISAEEAAELKRLIDAHEEGRA